jgi:hypothetical protein
MQVQIILHNDGNYYFLVDGQLANKLSKQDLEIVNAKVSPVASIEILRKAKLRQKQNSETYYSPVPNSLIPQHPFPTSESLLSKNEPTDQDLLTPMSSPRV